MEFTPDPSSIFSKKINFSFEIFIVRANKYADENLHHLTKNIRLKNFSQIYFQGKKNFLNPNPAQCKIKPVAI
jgi:hypothetical protein